MASMRTVRACQGEPVERKRYVAFIGDVLQMKGRIFPKKDGSVLREGYVRAFAYACLNAMAQMVALAAYFCSMWYGMTLILTNELDFGQLAAFQQYGFFIIAGINSITTANFMLAQLAGGAARVFALLARQPAFETQPGPWAMTPKDRMRGDLIFENITFTYPTRPEAPIIRGLTLHVPADTSAALVGSSGSGKSTLIQLLLRFYDPDSGRVLVDGHNVKSLDPQWLRGSIALVQQEPILFGVSIRENVAYGVAHRYISKDLDRAAVRVIGGPGREAPIPCDVDDSLDAIQSACKMSNAHDFISSFPDGAPWNPVPAPHLTLTLALSTSQATTPSAASAAPPSAAGRSSASPSRARSSASPACCCSTRRRPRSTPSRSGWCRRPSTA